MKNKKTYLFLLIFFLSFVILPAINLPISPIGAPLKESNSIQSRRSTSYSVQWLKNPTFTYPIGTTWYSTKSGDLSDISPRDGVGQANMTVIGKAGSVQFVANSPATYSLWKPFNNPDFPLGPWGTDSFGPNPGNGTDSAGYWARHVWDETVGNQLGQTPSIIWKRNVTMPVDMTDYTITSVYLTTIVNATVSQNVDCPGDPTGGVGPNWGVVYDYVRFYVVISTLDYVTKFEIAYNQTKYLGRGNTAGTFSSMGNTYLINIPTNVLISDLTQLLTADHYNFTITLGINIYCEDNLATDTDSFISAGNGPSLRIKSFNLTIGYTKKINQYTTIAWNQIGNQLPSINESQFLQVNQANLTFKYRSDKNWTTASPNSELRILVNNQTYPETIKLTRATRAFQDAKSGGFDVKTYISPNVNISVGIQIYLADAFILERNFTISIDDAYLWIDYTIGDKTSIRPPSLTALANTSIPFTNHWTNLTLTCQSGDADVSRWWYNNPFNNRNITLDSNFAGRRSYNLYFMNQTAGSYIFKFWANSTKGSAYTFLIVVWVKPQDPTLNLAINSSTPFINQLIQFTVTCQSGSANVSRLWYRDPFSGINTTIETNFAGIKVHYLNFTHGVAGSFEFRFWANSTLGNDAYKALTVIWVQPNSPILSVSANKTNPYTSQWTNITVTCQSGSGSVNTLWYYNPLSGVNKTLARNFVGRRTFSIINRSIVAGSFEYRFWANSTLGSPTDESMVIVWIPPQSPILSTSANSTTPFTDQWSDITVTCQSGSWNVSIFWYYNPLNGINKTLAKNFSGSRTFHIINRSLTAGVYEYKFWANSTLGSPANQHLIIVWITPQPLPPALSISANSTTVYTIQWTNITANCQSVSGNVDTFWYYNPLTKATTILAMDFAGSKIFNIIDRSIVSGPYEYKFWANSTLGSLASQSLTIVWLPPQSPVLSVSTNSTNPFTNQWTNITVTCQNGSGYVDTLWYYNPLNKATITLARSFKGRLTFNIINSSMKAGPYEYRIWANSSVGSSVYQSITIIWLSIQSPLLSVSANSTTLYITEWVNLTVTCQSGSGNVTKLWYYNPLDQKNHTLATNFMGRQVFNIINTNDTAGFYEYKFWVTSSLGSPVYQAIAILWTSLQPPSLIVIVNSTNPFTTQWVQIEVTCTSASGNVDHLWYNENSGKNNIIDTNFSGLRKYYLNFTKLIGGAFTFNFFANSSFAMEVTKSILVVWVNPFPPIVNAFANTTTLYITLWSQIIVTCQSGTGNVLNLWWIDPFDNKTKSLDTNFAGIKVFYLNFSNLLPISFDFWFYANDTFGLEDSDYVTIVWILPTPPIVNAFANTTTLYITLWSQIIVTCQSGTGNVLNLWWIDPFDNKTKSLDTNFAGIKVFYLNFSNLLPISFDFWFYANDTFGLEDSDYVTIVWILPTPPSLTVNATKVNPFVDERIQIRITCRAGTGPVNTLFYTDPFDGLNKTIATNFAGEQTFYLNFTSNVPGTFTFKVYANSTYGIYVIASATVGWVALPPAPLNVILLIGIFAGIIGAIAAVVGSYFLYFKVPKTIRGIRQLKSNILKGKPMNPLTVSQRGTIADNTFNRVMKESKLPVKKLEVPQELSKFKGKSD